MTKSMKPARVPRSVHDPVLEQKSVRLKKNRWCGFAYDLAVVVDVTSCAH